MDSIDRAEEAVFSFLDLAGELKVDRFGLEDLLFIIRNPDLVEYYLENIDNIDKPAVRRNAPKVRGGVPQAALVRSAPDADEEIKRVAQLADGAGLPRNASYRKLQEWGRTQGVRKGSDFWRAVSRVHRSAPECAPGAAQTETKKLRSVK